MIETEVAVWKKRKTGGRLQGAGEARRRKERTFPELVGSHARARMEVITGELAGCSCVQVPARCGQHEHFSTLDLFWRGGFVQNS